MVNTKMILARLDNIEKNIKALSTRHYTQKAEDAKSEAVKAQTNIEVVNAEVLESAITMTDFMEEYYTSQYGL